MPRTRIMHTPYKCTCSLCTSLRLHRRLLRRGVRLDGRAGVVGQRESESGAGDKIAPHPWLCRHHRSRGHVVVRDSHRTGRHDAGHEASLFKGAPCGSHCQCAPWRVLPSGCFPCSAGAQSEPGGPTVFVGRCAFRPKRPVVFFPASRRRQRGLIFEIVPRELRRESVLAVVVLRGRESVRVSRARIPLAPRPLAHTPGQRTRLTRERERRGSGAQGAAESALVRLALANHFAQEAVEELVLALATAEPRVTSAR